MNTKKNIKTFINSLTKNKITRVEINIKNTTILINKVITKNKDLHKEVKQKKIDKAQKIDQINLKEKENKTQKISGLYSTIISPMVGTFYRSPAPNEMSFIETGDTIKPKQIVCIIEAMKLMNEIESEVKGEVVEILVKDGDIIDCGQPLMKIRIK
uniref:Biotin carboxyl carrier protein of acetyl-CoA carboxylase n=1 Tax=Polysiphonia infestans TaxID=2006978 RepID=A0A1Z1MED1_9FLOR|nr:acetyl-CoA carboxylase biotin carboxyl carrier protein [Polysiphonia infestans]ARW64390.1 acetyl-CoA carboxylase biotin carboxyl carrier protein [Polysiphonia infestans]